MADMLQTGLAWLHTQRAAHMTTAATYQRRGVVGLLTINATASQIRYTRADANGMPVEALAWDFIVATTELAADPAPGDVVTYAGQRYEVMPLDDDAGWLWTDASRLARRIHAREVGAAGS